MKSETPLGNYTAPSFKEFTSHFNKQRKGNSWFLQGAAKAVWKWHPGAPTPPALSHPADYPRRQNIMSANLSLQLH